MFEKHPTGQRTHSLPSATSRRQKGAQLVHANTQQIMGYGQWGSESPKLNLGALKKQPATCLLPAQPGFKLW